MRESLAEQARGVEIGLATLRNLAGDGCEWSRMMLGKLGPEELDETITYHTRKGSIVNELTPFEQLHCIIPLGQMLGSIVLAHFYPHRNGRLDRFYADL